MNINKVFDGLIISYTMEEVRNSVWGKFSKDMKKIDQEIILFSALTALLNLLQNPDQVMNVWLLLAILDAGRLVFWNCTKLGLEFQFCEGSHTEQCKHHGAVPGHAAGQGKR